MQDCMLLPRKSLGQNVDKSVRKCLGKEWRELNGPFAAAQSKASAHGHSRRRHRQGVALKELAVSISSGESGTVWAHPQQPSHTQAEQTDLPPGSTERHFIPSFCSSN